MGGHLPKSLLKELVETLHKHLGDDLVAVALYGSWARGEGQPGSDIDLFIIARNLPKRRFPRAQHVHRAVGGRFPHPVSIVAKEPEEFERHFPSLYLDLGLDAVVLYDPQGYMTTRLARIKQLIQEAGLYRKRCDGDFVWLWKRPPRRPWVLDWEGFRELP